MKLSQVNPGTLPIPKTGRGAWRTEGIGFLDRYTINPATYPRIGTVAEQSLAHWAVAAGARAIQHRLQALGHLGVIAADDYGVWGPLTDTAIRRFQAANRDPKEDVALAVDGICGRGDSRALWTPVLASTETALGIPGKWLRGQVTFESGELDAGAVGYYIYYTNPDGSTRFGGIDRGLAQINSKANVAVTWDQSYDPAFAFTWTARNMRSRADYYRAEYPGLSETVLWEAAVCWHNSHVNGDAWAKLGGPPNEVAAAYVAHVKAAIY